MAARTIRVHATEVSTDGDAVLTYARGMAIALAIAVILAAAWIAMRPDPLADFAQPAGGDASADQLVISQPDALPRPLWLGSVPA